MRGTMITALMVATRVRGLVCALLPIFSVRKGLVLTHFYLRTDEEAGRQVFASTAFVDQRPVPSV